LHYFRNVTGLEINRGVFIDSSQQGFDFSIHMSSVVKITQLMDSALVFQAACYYVGLWGIRDNEFQMVLLIRPFL
jgi:hypothetical protein